MTRFLVNSLAAVVLLSGTTQYSSYPAVAPQASERAVVGILAAYDAQTRTLTVTVDKARERFVLAEHASVRVGPDPLAEDAITAHAGSRVKIRYRLRQGKRVVQTLMFSRSN